jgi:hypothetical protein
MTAGEALRTRKMLDPALLGCSVASLAVCLLLYAEPASAGPAFYFYKPAVEKAVFVTELGTCIELAGGASPSRAQTYSATPYAAAIGGLFSGIMASRERRAMVLDIMRTCMTDKGYRRVTAPVAVAKALNALDDEPRAARLFELATASTPLGEVLPK